MSLDRLKVSGALDAGAGVLRLEPCWVPRAFLMPGRRLRLHPDDLYAFGGHRGGIDERWFSSTIKASNGPLTTEDEGLSYIRVNESRYRLADVVETAGDLILGADVMEREKGWNILCKFFDNLGPIPHHMHQSEDDVVRCLENWNKGDNGILNHSRAYKLQPGTGWQVNAGILHAPGSLVTYEPQVRSDVFAMFQSEVEGRMVEWDLLTKDVQPEHHHDLDYLVSMLAWNENVNPEFGKTNQRFPKPVRPMAEMAEAGYRESWITYGTRHYSAKELTIFPKRTVTMLDSAAYGLIFTQGYGTLGKLAVSTPTMIRFGEMTQDELFVSAEAAKAGVRIQNLSETDPLVLLKHFGPGNPDAEPLVTNGSKK